MGGGDDVTETVTYDSVIGTLPNYEKTGYTLQGFNTSEDFSGDSLTEDTIWNYTEDKNAYAEWIANTYIVSLDVNGGSYSNESDGNDREVTYDSTYGTLPTPSQKGYAFSGWYLGDLVITSSSIVQTASDHTLTANWLLDTTPPVIQQGEYPTYLSGCPKGGRDKYLSASGTITDDISGVKIITISVYGLTSQSVDNSSESTLISRYSAYGRWYVSVAPSYNTYHGGKYKAIKCVVYAEDYAGNSTTVTYYAGWYL